MGVAAQITGGFRVIHDAAPLKPGGHVPVGVRRGGFRVIHDAAPLKPAGLLHPPVRRLGFRVIHDAAPLKLEDALNGVAWIDVSASSTTRPH